MSSVENTRDNGKRKLYTCTFKPVVSEPKRNNEESATFKVLTVEGDCVLDFCLEQDSYNSEHSKTNEVFSVLIDGRPRWLGHKRTCAINHPF